MATLRPHKQLPLLLLVSKFPRRPRALATLSGGNSPGTPSFCRPLSRHPAPYPPRSPGSAHSRPRAPRPARRSARPPPEAPGTPESRSPRRCSPALAPFPSQMLRGVGGSADRARGAGAQAENGLGHRALGVSFPLLRAHVSVPFPTLPTLSIVTVPAGRSDSPMPPAAQVRSRGCTYLRRPEAGRFSRQAAPSPPLYSARFPEADFPEASAEGLSLLFR